MKKYFLLLLTFIALLLSSCTTDWTEAENYDGKSASIKGPVMGIHVGNPTYINIGNDYPNENRFQAIIWEDDIDNFDLSEYEGKTIVVKGKVQMYEYEYASYSVPEIVVSKPSQIKIIKE